MYRSALRTTLSLAAVLALGATAANANHIDFIQDDSDPSNGTTNATFSLSTFAGGAFTRTQTGEPADILGGTRAVTFERTSAGGVSTVRKESGTDFILSGNSSAALSSVTLSYPGIDSLDFDTVYDAIDVTLSNVGQNPGNAAANGDAGMLDLTLTVDSGTGSGTASVTGITDAGTFRFLFTDPAFAGVDFTDVDGVSADFDTTLGGTSYQIASITREVVPEPASLALLGLGGLGLLRRRRA